MLTLKAPKMKLVKTTNGVGPDEAAHFEPPHKELQFASSLYDNSNGSLFISILLYNSEF